MFKLYVLLVLFFRGYGSLLYANPGHNVTLPCFYKSGSQVLWYKQVAGEQPQIISSFYKSSQNVFYDQFEDDKRFSVHTGEGFYHLNISSVRDSDSAMYFCGRIGFPVTEFDHGIFLVLSDSNHRSFLKQPASDFVKPGGSVTLNCTLHSGSSDGEHSVYWFKKDSRNSNLGILYVHEKGSSECVKSPESPAQCVYSLSKRNVSLSDAGMYYCAVASCGKILYGKGTRLDVGEKLDWKSPALLLSVAAALVVSVFLNMILIGILCKTSRRESPQPEGQHHQSSVPEYTVDSQNEESDALQYVALDFKKRQSKSRRQRSTEEETVYSTAKLSDL